MAEFLNKIPTNLTEYPNSFKRQGAFPLEAYSVFYSKAEAEAYAQSNPISYVGQTIAVVSSELVEEVATIKDVTLYIIDSEGGNLKEVGSVPAGDNQSIEVVNNKIQIKGFGKGYYKYNEEAENHYEFKEGEFIAGLQPQIIASEDGTGYEIAWFEPNPTTVEGLETQISSLSGSVNSLGGRVDSNTDALEKVSTRIETIENAGYATQVWVESKNYLTEHQDITGKVDKTELSKYYTKDEANTEFMTEAEVDARVNEVIAAAVADDAIHNLTELVQYLDAHGDVAEQMATDIANLQSQKADKTELEQYATISVVEQKVGENTTRIEAVEKNLTDNYDTSAQVNEKLAGYQVKITESNKLSYELIEGTPTIPTIDHLASTEYVNAEVSKINAKAEANASAIQTINATLESKVNIEQVNTAIASAKIQASQIEGKVATAEKADYVANAISFVVSREEGAQPVEYNGGAAKTVNIVEIVDSAIETSEIETNGKISALDVRATSLEEEVAKLKGANAQENVIEKVQVGGEELAVSNKTVNIDKISTDLLVQGSKLLILDGGSASN